MPQDRSPAYLHHRLRTNNGLFGHPGAQTPSKNHYFHDTADPYVDFSTEVETCIRYGRPSDGILASVPKNIVKTTMVISG